MFWDALSQVARRFRTRIGESPATIKAHLKAYSTAWTFISAGHDDSAVPLLKRAIAMAYASLGRAYGDTDEPGLSRENTTASYRWRDRSNDSERLFIDVSCGAQVTGSEKSALGTCEAWVKAYPWERNPHSFMARMIYQFHSGVSHTGLRLSVSGPHE